jgi:hypothetical protein
MWPELRKESVRSARSVFPATLALIGAVALYNWIVAPHCNYLAAAQRFESTASNLVKKNGTISRNVATQRQQLRELQEKLDLIQSRFFEPVEAEEFFSEIQTTSEEANCAVHSLGSSASESAPNASRLNTGASITSQRAILSVLGEYGDIMVLMDKLQNSSKHVRIDSVKICPESTGSARLKCDMTITIHVIHREEGYAHGKS